MLLPSAFLLRWDSLPPAEAKLRFSSACCSMPAIPRSCCFLKTRRCMLFPLLSTGFSSSASSKGFASLAEESIHPISRGRTYAAAFSFAIMPSGGTLIPAGEDVPHATAGSLAYQCLVPVDRGLFCSRICAARICCRAHRSRRLRPGKRHAWAGPANLDLPSDNRDLRSVPGRDQRHHAQDGRRCNSGLRRPDVDRGFHRRDSPQPDLGISALADQGRPPDADAALSRGL